MDKKRVTRRLTELLEVFKRLPEHKQILLKTTIETVAFMDIQLKDLEEVIASGAATTPDKQLYASMAKTRDVLMKKLLTELPPEEEDSDGFEEF